MEGGLRKMVVTADADGQVHYALRLDDSTLPLNSLLGKTLQLSWQGTIRCIHCQRMTRKSFAQGYCYPCFTRLARCDTCIMSPERCHYHHGTCREPAWGEQHCMAPHLVYLANSSALKVGITKPAQLPTRWLDQGATQAIGLLDVTTRYQSGVIEDLLRQRISDRTAWQTMLKGSAPPLDMSAMREEVTQLFADSLVALQQAGDLEHYRWRDDAPRHFHYPVLDYPRKVRSHNLERSPQLEGQLLGLKGQYLLLDTGVINLRKYSGYQVRFTTLG